jgi:hypothetical protein
MKLLEKIRSLFRPKNNVKVETVNEPKFTFSWEGIILSAILSYVINYVLKFIDWFGQSKSPKGQIDIEDIMASIRAGISMSLVLFIVYLLESFMPFISNPISYVVVAVIVTLGKKYISSKVN